LVVISLVGRYSFGKIIKTVATRRHILKLKCSKFDFGWGSAPDPVDGAYRALAGFKGPIYKGRITEEERKKGGE